MSAQQITGGQLFSVASIYLQSHRTRLTWTKTLMSWSWLTNLNWYKSFCKCETEPHIFILQRIELYLLWLCERKNSTQNNFWFAFHPRSDNNADTAAIIMTPVWLWKLQKGVLRNEKAKATRADRTQGAFPPHAGGAECGRGWRRHLRRSERVTVPEVRGGGRRWLRIRSARCVHHPAAEWSAGGAAVRRRARPATGRVEHQCRHGAVPYRNRTPQCMWARVRAGGRQPRERESTTARRAEHTVVVAAATVALAAAARTNCFLPPRATPARPPRAPTGPPTGPGRACAPLFAWIILFSESRLWPLENNAMWLGISSACAFPLARPQHFLPPPLLFQLH
jgi:hypothetical protein